MNNFKKTFARTMFSTGASLVILTIFLVIIGDENINTNTVFEIFGANILINIGLLLRNKFEIRYFIIEFIVDVSYIILILLTFGYVFDWISTVPVWYLVIMAIVIYLFAIITMFVKIKKDTKEINDLLQKRKEKM